MERKVLKIIILVMLVCCFCFTGCSNEVREKESIPEPKYDKIGSAIRGYVDDQGTVIITYAVVGITNEHITYVYLDQIENNPRKDRHLFTNKELETAYGLSYKSDHGEWYQQVEALENYIVGNKMTIDEINRISTNRTETGKIKPTQGTDLEAACELDIGEFLEVINFAYESSYDVEAMKIGVGEDIRISVMNNKIDVIFTFIATDYRYKICYAELEKYSVIAEKDSKVISQKEKAKYDMEALKESNGIEAFEDYIIGLNLEEAYGIETYDPGNGIETALPKKGTDLAQICSIDLANIIIALGDVKERL